VRAAAAMVAVAPFLLPGLALPEAAAQGLKPKLPDLSGIVKDADWATVLGKALFWDTTVGSDGMACASCHFHAGADIRLGNALSPGLIELPAPSPSSAAIPVAGPHKGTNAAGVLNPLDHLGDDDIDDIIEFLKALTDARVQCDMAPSTIRSS
jgi:mono/diheme cytochrome c family protein